MPSHFTPFACFIVALFVSGCSAASNPQSPATTATVGMTNTPAAGPWKSLFNGKDLAGLEETKFGASGTPTVEDGKIVVPMGAGLSGVNWTNAAALPKMNYEIELEAMKVEGGDFFCGLTFPVGESFASLIVGGWGGGVVGISSLDGLDASENETMKSLYFEPKRWFRIGLRVTPNRLVAMIDGATVIDVDTTGKKVHLRVGEIDLSKPLGVATYQTTAALRNIRVRELKAK